MLGRLLRQFCVGSGLLLAAGVSASAADLPAEMTPELRGVLREPQIATDRLKLAFDLTTPKEQEQFPVLKDFIDVFLYGVDPKLPVRADLLTSGQTTQYRLLVPVNNFQDFWKLNLVPLGIPVREYTDAPGFYRLGGGNNDAFTGYMRYAADQRHGYAAIAEDFKVIPADMPDPLPGAQELLAGNPDVALVLKNKPGGVAERHKHSAAQKAEALGKLARDTAETAADFNLRKEFASFQFDEMELYYSEAEDLKIAASVDPTNTTATTTLKFKPLPETSLARNMMKVGTVPSRFTGVPRGPVGTTSGRILLPLDKFHQDHLTSLIDRAAEQQTVAIAANATKSPEQKAATTQIMRLSFDLIQEQIAAGLFDGFFEMSYPTSGPATMVGAVKAVDGTKWAAVLEQIPKAYPDASAKLNASEYKGVSLHEVVLSKADHASFFQNFGDGRVLVGTAPDSMWYAAGADAEAALKKAIDDAAAPGQPSMEAVSFRGEIRWWLQLLDERLGAAGQAAYRDLAIEAFGAQEGRVQMSVVRNGDVIDGSTSIDRGVVRFVGKALAKFSSENLK